MTNANFRSSLKAALKLSTLSMPVSLSPLNKPDPQVSFLGGGSPERDYRDALALVGTT